ncbi:MAG: slipin family protein [Eubacteriales bacterium]|jgi:regulator of protease activity HflC (stomatin/prohibitin superfamily)
MPALIGLAGFAAIVAIILIILSLVVINEYERGVVFRFGKCVSVKRPGLRMRLPFGIDVVKKVDIRVRTIDVPQQEIITKDNVSIKVDAVVYYRIEDPVLVVTKVVNYHNSTAMLGQTTLRSVLGQHELDEILANRENLNRILKDLLSETMTSWGIVISSVELKSIEIPDSMKRAMAKQAEAERERRAKITAAEGEEQSAKMLFNASEIISRSPAALQLRYLQTLNDIAAEKNSTIIFPLPMDFINTVSKIMTPGQAKTE